MTSQSPHPATHEPARGARVATAALLVAGAVFCARLADGAFLADDLALLATFAHADGSGRLFAEVLARFTGGVDGANAFWRPLTYGTFALNYQLAGADARAWLAVNLALHLANAALVGLLVRRLALSADSHKAGLFAAIVFFALASGWEAALWIASRYDALATLFVLLAGWFYAGNRPRLALVATALALMSKESGAVSLILVACLAIAREVEGAAVDRHATMRRLAARLWPFVVIGLAYAALRFALFGQATRAYAGAPVDLASPAHWQELFSTGIAWSRAVFPGPPGLRPIAALAAIGVLALGLAAASRPAKARLLALLAALALTSVLMLTHLPSFDPSGIGGRLLYLPGALFAVALGLAFAGTAHVAARLLAAILVVTHAYWMFRAAEEYHAIHGEMRAVVAGIAAHSAQGAGPPALLLVPDALGRAPFGRNAQAGLMLPPVQRAALTRHVLVQLDTEIPEIPAKVSRGLFDWLTRHSLFEYPGDKASLPGARDVEPSAYLCWNPSEHRLRPMAVGPAERAMLAKRIEEAYVRAGCRP